LSYGEGVTIEIKKPELEAFIQERLNNGMFHDVDELLQQAFDALDEKQPSPSKPPRQNLADFLLNSPFAGAELHLERRKEYLRAPDL
jgi:hypothetical protein